MRKKAAKRLPKKTAAKGVIGPHNERELELMLAGAKPLARFTREHGAATYEEVEAAFRPHVERGAVLRFFFRSEDTERVYFCLPTEEWRVKLLELIETALEVGAANAFTIYDLHRIDGAMLGYAKEDVEFFVARWRRHHPQDD